MADEHLTDEELQQSKQVMVDTLSDLFKTLIYYDRKEDEDLPRDRIELLVARGITTPEEIVDEFRKHVMQYFKGPS